MKLEEKIADRKIAYLFRRNESIAFELALLYFILAKRKKAGKKISDACLKSTYWLKKAEVEIPEYLKQLSPSGQLEEIEKILVINKSRCFDRDKAKVDARRCWQPVDMPELCKQFGLA
ncbi:MAG: hypothetical protein ABIA67_06255 [Candidatus Margulisiibacteriota bacterium]